MLRKTKKYLALFIASVLFCSNFPIGGNNMKIMAAGEAPIEAEDAISVSFDEQYAEVGKELSVTVEDAAEVSYEWTVGGESMDNNTDSYIPIEDDLEKWIEVVVTDGERTGSTKLYCSKLPVVYIDTNNQEITSKEDYIDATMTIQGNATYNPDTTTLYNGAIEIRGRGNTTWTKPKKPYKLKLDKKTDVFGMGKNKHWVLLANYLDESLMRNTLTYDLSGSMGMEQMSTVWVDVVMNGQYAGNYQFCEQVRVDSTRVDIFDWEGFAEDSAAVIADIEGLDEGDLADYMLENMGWITSGKVDFESKTYQISDYDEIEIPSINGGYILELDEYYDEVSKFKTNSQQPMMFKNPEFVYTNDDMMAYVKTYVQAFEDAVKATDYTAEYDGADVHYSELYDFNALVDYWLLNEIFYNEEFNKKSTYMYKEIDELMKMGPMWDMDWSSGAAGTSATATNRWATLNFSANAQRNQWYKSLVKDPYFLMKVQERYWEVRDVQVQDMLDSIDVHYEYLKESGAADSEIWTLSGCDAATSERKVTFDQDVANLKDWLDKHISWMDENMSTEDSFDASFMTKNSSLSLNLFDANGNELREDITDKAPADAVDETGKELTLSISTSNSGNAHIYVNGKKCAAIQAINGETEYVLPTESLNADAGTKNIIEVKILNASNSVVAENYITVKVEEAECNHTNTRVEPISEPTCTEAGSEKIICEDCDYEEIVEIESLGHDWEDDYTVDLEPTYDAEGSKSIHCSRCDIVKEGSSVSIPVLSRNPFVDVEEKEFFYDAVLWALENEITTGTSPTTFEPFAACTRGQELTFLWRAAGKPAYTLTENPFEDVKEEDYFYDAVLWALENEITTGTSPTTFEPYAPITRAQVVTFLWREAGEPVPTLTKNPFIDVDETQYYYQAVLWALENGITTGTSPTTFEPEAECIRGQIVTFLYRNDKLKNK